MLNTTKLAEARAILASVKASLCPHGVRWRDCKQHDHANTSSNDQGADRG